MEKNDESLKTPRREFLGALATSAVAMSIATLATPLQAIAKSNPLPENGIDDADAWFNKLKGKHKIVFDATRPHEVFPFAWPAVFMMTNEATGTMAKDQGIVVVLRHSAIAYAFEDRLWAKYNFGEVFKAGEIGPAFKAADNKTAVSKRNPFWKPKEGDFQLPGVGNVAIGINDLQQKGVMFCVCYAAITVYSAAIAQGMNMKAEDVKKDWMNGLLPGIQVVPSGVWAVGRAQEHGCAYCFAG
jgi:intracellular sulfur oxidation DsrE/DsrF family protein